MQDINLLCWINSGKEVFRVQTKVDEVSFIAFSWLTQIQMSALPNKTLWHILLENIINMILVEFVISVLGSFESNADL